MIPCGLGSYVSEKYTTCNYRRQYEDGGNMFFGKVCIPHYFSALWIENEVIKWGGGAELGMEK
jgi:hypothetical protein